MFKYINSCLNIKHKSIKMTSLILIACLAIIICPIRADAVAYPYTITTTPTPHFTSVTVWDVTGEFTPYEISQADLYMDAEYPNATRLRSTTGKYNCHSYAWYSTSVYNHFWMNDPSAYWQDGSYSFVAIGDMFTIPTTVNVGDKVSYGPSHSAIVASSTKFKSKWGDYGLYQHFPGYCPYFQPSVAYYR